MRIISQQNQSFIDTQIMGVGTLITLFESALESGVSITDIPEPGTEVLLVDIDAKEKFNLPLPVLVIPKQKKVRALNNQNYQDLSIQELGGLEHLFELALINGVSITGAPVLGDAYCLPEIAISELVTYLDAKGIKLATGTPPFGEYLFETGLFENGLFA